MGLSPYIIGGLATGVGQGIQNGVSTIASRRKEEELNRRQRLKEERDERRLDQADKREQDAYNRGIFGQEMSFAEKGGVIEDDPTDNGTGSIGMHVGVSTATTQPSEHEGIPMREVGRYGGKRYLLPADGLTPAERLKQKSRVTRAQAVAGQQYYKPRPDEIEALDDPEVGDDTYKDIRSRDWALNPQNIRAQAAVAGARAAATAPYRQNSESDKGPDGLTAAQRRTANRLERGTVIDRANRTATEARTEAEKEPKRAEYGYNGVWVNPRDSVAYTDDVNRADVSKVGAKFRGGMAGYTADSTARAGVLEGRGGDPDDPKEQEREGVRRIQHAYEIYQRALAEAKTPEAKKEARQLYLTIRNQTLTAIGRRPRDPNN